MPEGVGLDEGEHERPDHVEVGPVLQLLEDLPPGHAQLHALQGQAQLVGHGRVEVLADDAEGGVEAAPGLHRHRQHVDDVGQVLEDGVGPLADAALQAGRRQDEADDRQHDEALLGRRRQGHPPHEVGHQGQDRRQPQLRRQLHPRPALTLQPGQHQLALDLVQVLAGQQPLEAIGDRPADHAHHPPHEGLAQALLEGPQLGRLGEEVADVGHDPPTPGEHDPHDAPAEDGQADREQGADDGPIRRRS